MTFVTLSREMLTLSDPKMSIRGFFNGSRTTSKAVAFLSHSAALKHLRELRQGRYADQQY